MKLRQLVAHVAANHFASDHEATGTKDTSAFNGREKTAFMDPHDSFPTTMRYQTWCSSSKFGEKNCEPFSLCACLYGAPHAEHTLLRTIYSFTRTQTKRITSTNHAHLAHTTRAHLANHTHMHAHNKPHTRTHTKHTTQACNNTRMCSLCRPLRVHIG